MKTWALFAAMTLVVLTGPIQASAQQSLENLVAQCVSETRATGSYELVGKKRLQVTPAEGGTQAGAHNVNDCLLDKRAVQFSEGKDGKAIAAKGLIPAQECRRDRNSRIAIGLVLTAGTAAALGGDGAIVGGVAGSVVGIRRVNQDYRECLALAGQVNAGRSGSNTHPAIPVAGCRRDVGVLQGGSSICVGY